MLRQVCLFGIDGQRCDGAKIRIAAEFGTYRASRLHHFGQVNIAEFREAHAKVAETEGDVVLVNLRQ